MLDLCLYSICFSRSALSAYRVAHSNSCSAAHISLLTCIHYCTVFMIKRDTLQSGRDVANIPSWMVDAIWRGGQRPAAAHLST